MQTKGHEDSIGGSPTALQKANLHGTSNNHTKGNMRRKKNQ